MYALPAVELDFTPTREAGRIDSAAHIEGTRIGHQMNILRIYRIAARDINIASARAQITALPKTCGIQRGIESRKISQIGGVDTHPAGLLSRDSMGG